MANETLKLVLFDVDGTIVDSLNHIAAATQAAFQSHGLTAPDRSMIRGGIGLSVPDAMARLLPMADVATVEKVGQSYRQAFFDLRMADQSNSLSPLFPGIRDALDTLAGDPFTLLGVATGKSRRGLMAMLDAHDLDDMFITLQQADDHPSKPHPSMIHTALRETGASAQHTVMIGDTTFDMAMAQAAGVAGLGVSWGYHAGGQLAAAGAQAIAHDTGALPALVRDLLDKRG